MIQLVKNLKCISWLNIHYYPTRRYKSYITTLKAVIVGKSLISAGLDIDRIMHFVFYDKILQIYQQHQVRKVYRDILSKYRQILENCGGRGGGGCYTLHTTRLTRPWSQLPLLERQWFLSDKIISLVTSLQYLCIYSFKSYFFFFK